jgi:hypothetical protein
MAEIRSLSLIKDKWARVTPQRTDDYRLGIQSPRRDWAISARSQEPTWKAAITEAAAKGRFGAGIDKAGTKKWQARALAKGPTRFAEGVMVGAEDYIEGYKPYHEEIARVEMPPRMPIGDPRNYERSKAIGIALHSKKMAR